MKNYSLLSTLFCWMRKFTQNQGSSTSEKLLQHDQWWKRDNTNCHLNFSDNGYFPGKVIFKLFRSLKVPVKDAEYAILMLLLCVIVVNESCWAGMFRHWSQRSRWPGHQRLIINYIFAWSSNQGSLTEPW